MSNYRHTIYRYSTGQGPNLAAEMVPTKKYQAAAYKFTPLRHKLSLPQAEVALVREADRISYQVEEADRIIKVMGYDSEAARKRNILKDRLELVNHLMMNYPITRIKYIDLERLHDMWRENASGIDDFVGEIVQKGKIGKDAAPYVKAARGTRKGYPVIDKFGQVIALPKAKKKGISGLGELGFVGKNWVRYFAIVGAILLAAKLLK